MGMFDITTRSGGVYPRYAWTGGDTPPPETRTQAFYFPYREIRREIFRELLQVCGGLDLWKCAGTSSMERARIFWREASYDAWRTFQRSLGEGEY